MEHSKQCLELQFVIKKVHNEWVAKWPNYCRKCSGAGMFTWQENQSPFGSGYVWLETLSEPCGDCLMNGKCPRCGGVYTDEDCESPCNICGWDFDDQCPPEKMEYPCECEFTEHDFGVLYGEDWIPVDEY